jgi:DNA-binding SARP family transcriptional activator
MQTRWRIELLGGLRATHADRVVTRFRTQRTGALLAYLAYFLHRSHPREALIELLWPESEPDAGRHSLSQSLSSLRHLFEPPGVPPGAILVADRFAVGLNPDLVATDVGEFQAALQEAVGAGGSTERVLHLTRAVELYGRELLPLYYE